MAVNCKPFLLPLGIFLLSLSDLANGQNVDAGSKRFTIMTQKRNWYQANHACTASGMSLASIESQAEHTALRNYLINNDLFGKEFWLSGSTLDTIDSSEFTWLASGNKLRYAQWQIGQPNITLENACIYTDTQFKWASEACTTLNKKYYICSRLLVPNCGITGRCKRINNFI